MSGRRRLAEGVAKGVLVATMAGMTPAVMQAVITPSIAYADVATVATPAEFKAALENPAVDIVELADDLDMTATTYYSNQRHWSIHPTAYHWREPSCNSNGEHLQW